LRLGLGRGTLRIVIVASAATVVLPALLDRFHKQWPNLQLQITEAVEDKLDASIAAAATSWRAIASVPAGIAALSAGQSGH
jgi:DNA-binding transcriptional LysR family regulator